MYKLRLISSILIFVSTWFVLSSCASMGSNSVTSKPITFEFDSACNQPIVNSKKQEALKSAIQMVYLRGGSFSRKRLNQGAEHENAVKDFYLGTTEVSQEVWKLVMEDNPSTYLGDNLPVSNVSWIDIQLFVNRLNRILCTSFRLPTELEWRYAASRHEQEETEFLEEDNKKIDNCVNFNLDHGPCAIASYEPNYFGLFDMFGNVWEWTDSTEAMYAHGKRMGKNGKIVKGGDWSSGRVFKSHNQYLIVGEVADVERKEPFIGFRLAHNK